MLIYGLRSTKKFDIDEATLLCDHATISTDRNKKEKLALKTWQKAIRWIRVIEETSLCQGQEKNELVTYNWLEYI